MSELPRFTGSLRAFAGVACTQSEDPYTQQRLQEELKWRKKEKESITSWKWGDVEKLAEKATDTDKVFHFFTEPFLDFY